MKYKDYYQIMGVSRDASQDEIKRAHRKLARKYHPDVSKESDGEERFKELGEAYEVLKDPEKRAAYDRLDPNMQADQDFQPPPGWDSGFEFRGGATTGGTEGFSSFFEELFGHQQGYGAQSSRNTTGEDHHAKVMVDLDDVFHGATRKVTLQSPELDASGHVRLNNHTITFKIPKGMKEGQQLRLKGQGAMGMGQGAKGNLYLEIHFNPHPIYRAEGRDLHLQLPVTPWEVALGATVQTPTPEGAVGIKIPAGSNSGKKLRLKGRGIPGNPAGDIYVTLNVIVPPANDEQAKALYKEMESKLAFNPRAGLGV